MKRFSFRIITALLLVLVGALGAVGYKIYDFTRPTQVLALTTPWTDSVDADNPLPDYPRPQLRRDNWLNLNGRWRYAVTQRNAPQPKSFEEEIVVPFAIESFLSGVQKQLGPNERLWYQHTFETPSLNDQQRLLLHFGAVDWEAEVWVNGYRQGIHQGGYDPFTFDITDSLVPNGAQELIVGVWDPTNLGPGAYGKQHLVPHGIRYTAVSGIWQTVWLEVVPADRIDKLVSSTDLAANEVQLRIGTIGENPTDVLEATVFSGDELVAEVRTAAGRDATVVRIVMKNLRLWSPDDPFLYDVKIRMLRNEEELDFIESYFGAREVATLKDAAGTTRLFLNGKPVFHLGLLDQGWWPDGLYTAPTDEALAFDIDATKRMGFNTIRKHVKVEPARWYWHADRMGLLVWQDMPTGDGGASRYTQILRQTWDIIAALFSEKPWRDMVRNPISAALFESELAAMIDYLEPFTSVVAWVPFNEAWGQFDTDTVLFAVSERDPGRLVDGPSGWFDTGAGDILDLHVYGREAAFVDQLPLDRALVYGEFGGLGLPLAGHLSVDKGWGYAAFESKGGYEAAYMEMLLLIENLVPRGLAGAIYTQTTDVESEINGLMTYDRRLFKISPARLTEINEQVISKLNEGD